MTLGRGGAPHFTRLSAQAPAPHAAADVNWDTRFGLLGSSYTPYAVAVAGKKVYVGGYFTALPGEVDGTANHVMMWDGKAWSAMGIGTNGDVNAVAVSAGKVYVGGDFTSAGGQAANYVAVFSNGQWSPLSTGLGDSAVYDTPEVNAMAVSSGILYVGGTFDLAGGVTVHSIAAWDGTAWSALGGGVLTCLGCGDPTSGTVESLLPMDNTLVVGGDFSKAGAVVTSSVATWDGTTWASFGGGTGAQDNYGDDGNVRALTTDGTHVFAGGDFDQMNGAAVPGIGEWVNGAWTAVGGGAMYYSSGGGVESLIWRAGKLYAGGQWSEIGGTTITSLAKWNGTTWLRVGPGIDNPVVAMAPSGTTGFVALGSFNQAGTNSLGGLATWTGKKWKNFGQGVSSGTCCGWTTSVATNGTDVYTGGDFSQSGSAAASNIAHFNGTNWVPMGRGVNDIVNAIAIDGTNVYVGGNFTTAGSVAASHVAKWNGTRWSTLGSGVNGDVNALLIRSGRLWVGGDFTAAGRVSVSNLATYNLTKHTWARVGRATYDGPVQALSAMPAPFDTDVAIGGSFPDLTNGKSGTAYRAATVNAIVLFDTSAAQLNWKSGYLVLSSSDGNPDEAGVTIPSGGYYYAGEVMSIGYDATGLWVGGDFTQAGSVAAASLARFDFQRGWQSRGGVGGLSGTVDGIAVVGDVVYVTGSFTSAGTKNAAGVAGYNTTSRAWSTLGSGLDQLGQPFAPEGIALAEGSAGLWVAGEYGGVGGHCSWNIGLWTATAGS